MKVELIFDADCPHLEEARQTIRSAAAAANIAIEYLEHCRQDPAAPGYAMNFGSPSILVDGADVEPGSGAPTADCCRIYRDENGQAHGAPSAAKLLRIFTRRTTWPPANIDEASAGPRESDASCD
ncbi:MAG: hypothetical protein K1X75_17605 [Leptospirales bacterium]|nr:hypothetical protein [Leptospirales bacterium]